MKSILEKIDQAAKDWNRSKEEKYKKEWKKFGVDLRMTAPGLERILSWGTRKHNEIRDNPPVIE